MSNMEAVRRRYRVPAKRGARVRVRIKQGEWDCGSVTSVNASQHVLVRPDSQPWRRVACHPTDATVLRWARPTDRGEG